MKQTAFSFKWKWDLQVGDALLQSKGMNPWNKKIEMDRTLRSHPNLFLCLMVGSIKQKSFLTDVCLTQECQT